MPVAWGIAPSDSLRFGRPRSSSTLKLDDALRNHSTGRLLSRNS